MKVQTDSTGCGQWSWTSQELHSGVHWGWVRGCSQSFGKDPLYVAGWQLAFGGDRCLQQGKVWIHTHTLFHPHFQLLFSSSLLVYWCVCLFTESTHNVSAFIFCELMCECKLACCFMSEVDILCKLWKGFMCALFFISDWIKWDWNSSHLSAQYLIMFLTSISRCLSNREDDKRVLSLHVDKDAHSLYVAFSSCVIRIPLSRCERHSSCHKWVILMHI